MTAGHRSVRCSRPTCTDRVRNRSGTPLPWSLKPRRAVHDRGSPAGPVPSTTIHRRYKSVHRTRHARWLRLRLFRGCWGSPRPGLRHVGVILRGRALHKLVKVPDCKTTPVASQFNKAPSCCLLPWSSAACVVPVVMSFCTVDTSSLQLFRFCSVSWLHVSSRRGMCARRGELVVAIP